jgi:hypothetical protein
MGTQVMSAQHHENDKRQPRKRMTIERMTDMQANKIIGDLGLDDKTAAKFKDVYAKYMKEMNDLRKEGMDFRMRGRIQKGDTLAKMKMQMPTDAEVDKMMRDKFKMGRKMLDIREKYYDEFRKFLSPKQVQKVYDHGQMNRGKFHKEMNRRAGMKGFNSDKHEAHPGRPMAK